MMTWVALTILLLLVGAVFLAVEVFLLPGVVIGVIGGVSVVAAGVLAWAKLGPTWGAVTFSTGILLSLSVLFLLPRTGLGRSMVLRTAQQGTRANDPGLSSLTGSTGRALTTLRPAGTVDIGGRTVDVVTDGLFVEAGTPVRVARIEGGHVIVEPIPKEDSSG